MLTILMATFNGARTLPGVLNAYCQIKSPADGWKLVIADNGSTDNSKEIIKGFENRLPITYVYEAKRGKNAALNTALSEVSGDLIIFTDDDAKPAPDWLLQLSACAASNPDYAIFGGTILPEWELEPPDWILRLVPLGLTYALTAPDLEEGPIFPGLVWGPNMAVRREVFNSGHRFNDTIGPNGSNYAMGSETEFTIRLSRAGYKSWFCKKAVVQHFIRANQVQKSWVLKRAFRFGRGMYRQSLESKAPETPMLFGVPRWMLRKFVSEALYTMVGTIAQNADRSFTARWEVNYLLGYFYEARTESSNKDSFDKKAG